MTKFKIGDRVKTSYFYKKLKHGTICSSALLTRQGKLYYHVLFEPAEIVSFYEEDLDFENNDWGDGE